MPNKIVLIGRAGVGKTSIKNVIFEGVPPNDLILFPLEPTRGINTSSYSWLDLELVIFDTAGQELTYLLENEDEHRKLFSNSDVFIYIFDYLLWVDQSEEILDEILKVFNIINQNGNKGKLILFFHKIDQINQKIRGKFQIIVNEIRSRLDIPVEFKIFFTSLHPNLIYRTYNAFFEVLSALSPETSNIKNIIDTVIEKYSKTIFFVTDQFNNIIVQTMTKDFDTNLISYLHEKIAHMDQTTEELNEIYNHVFLIDSGFKILSSILSNLEQITPNIKNLNCVSEIHDVDTLTGLMNNLKEDLHNFYNSKRYKTLNL